MKDKKKNLAKFSGVWDKSKPAEAKPEDNAPNKGAFSMPAFEENKTGGKQ